jgi:Na+/melibiose symporter-like transporter
MQNTGLGIATGSKWKIASNSFLGNDLFDNAQTSRITGDQKSDPNYYAIVALALAVIGLLLSLLNARSATGAAMVSGALSIIALIGLWIDLKRKVNDSVSDAEKAGDLGIDKIKVSLELTPWFYIAIVVFLVATIFCYRRLQQSK